MISCLGEGKNKVYDWGLGFTITSTITPTITNTRGMVSKVQGFLQGLELVTRDHGLLR